MTAHPDKATLAEYDALSTRFQTGGGYETDMQTDKICNGLGIPAAQRQQDFRQKALAVDIAARL